MTKLCRRFVLGFGTVIVTTPSIASSANARQLPQPGDRLLVAGHPDASTPLRADAIIVGQPPIRARAFDPASRAIRDQTTLGQLLVLRLDRSVTSTAETLLSADGIIAYSAVCTHAGCIVVGWKPADHRLLCPCHGSAYDAAAFGQVVAGPAPRSLPMLPLRIDDDVLVVSQPFTSQIGASTGRTD